MELQTAAASLGLTARGEQQILLAFRTGRATTLAGALRLKDLGLRDSAQLRELVRATIIRRSGKDRYFLDEGVWARRRNLKAGVLLRITVLVVFIMISVALLVAGR